MIQFRPIRMVMEKVMCVDRLRKKIQERAVEMVLIMTGMVLPMVLPMATGYNQVLYEPYETTCDDGIDNDADSLTDMQDPSDCNDDTVEYGGGSGAPDIGPVVK